MMNMSRSIVILSVLLFFSVNNGFAHFAQISVDGKKSVKFTAKAGQLGQQTPDNEFLQGKAGEDVVEYELPGEVYEQSFELTAIAKNEADRLTPLNALRSFYSSNLAGDAQWIVDDFIGSEHERMGLMTQNLEILKKNTDRFAKIKRMDVLGFVDYGSYKIFFVQETFEDSVQTVPVVLTNVNGQWLRTNVLHEDKVFDLIFTSLSS